MKITKHLLLVIISMFIFLPNTYALDEVSISHEQQNILDDKNNLIGVEIVMNIEAPDAVAIQHEIEFDNEKLNLKEVTPNGSFTLTQGEYKKNDKKTKIAMVVDGEYGYSSAPYLKLYFEFTDKFIPYTDAKIRFSKIMSSGMAEKLTRLPGKEITLSMNGTNMLSSSSLDIDEKATIKEWAEKNKIYIYIAAIVIVALIVLDLIHISLKNRKQNTPFNTNAQFFDNNAKHLRNTFTDTQENENRENGIDPDKYKYRSIILFMLGLSIISIGTVFAVQGAKNQDIRDYIVGRTEGKSLNEIDINGDGNINVLDLVLEKNIKNYKVIKINEWNTDFKRNMNLYFIDIFQSKIPLEIYSVEYGNKRHISLNTKYNINAMQCELGTIENFKKTDNPNDYTYEFDYTLNEGIDNCYLQAIGGN